MEPKPLDSTTEVRIVLKTLEMRASEAFKRHRLDVAWAGVLGLFGRVEQSLDAVDAVWRRFAMLIARQDQRIKELDAVIGEMRRDLAALCLRAGGRISITKQEFEAIPEDSTVSGETQPDGTFVVSVQAAPEPQADTPKPESVH